MGRQGIEFRKGESGFSRQTQGVRRVLGRELTHLQRHGGVRKNTTRLDNRGQFMQLVALLPRREEPAGAVGPASGDLRLAGPHARLREDFLGQGWEASDLGCCSWD